ncbi:UNVERIFIED_CONTAM: hypothetical protein Sindi_1288300, partial [Sesamum indicum]
MDTAPFQNDFCSTNDEGRMGSKQHSSASTESVFRVCRCGRDVHLRTSWTTLNSGRRLRGCPGNA